MEATAVGRSLDDSQEFLSGYDLWEEVFFCHELFRVHTPPAPPQPYRMLQMQHLVVEDVLDYITRHAPVVKYPADDDGIVRGIVMAEAVAGVLVAPR
jgi:hypothetical protein